MNNDDQEELDQLRKEKANREKREAKAAQDEKNAEPEPIYWLTLANGEVVKSTGQMTHYKGIPVVGCARIVEKEETNA